MNIQLSPAATFPQADVQYPVNASPTREQPKVAKIVGFAGSASGTSFSASDTEWGSFSTLGKRGRRGASAMPSTPGVNDLKPVPSKDGKQHFVGTLPGGETIMLTRDPMGNLHGMSNGRFYFRRSDEPAGKPLAPLTRKEFVKQRDQAYLAKIPGLSSISFFGSSSIAPPGKTSPENDYYRCTLADGTEVYLHIDPWGNLHGADKGGHYYYQRDVAANPQPLQPLSPRQYSIEVINGETAVDGDKLTVGHFFRQIANPFNGLSDLLQLAGVDEDTANRVEGWANNPIGNVIKAVNHASGNGLGKLFGLSEQEFEQKALAIGDFAKNFVPMYGQLRFFTDLVHKAVCNEPMTPEEIRSLGVMLKMEGRAPAGKTADTPAEPAPPKEVEGSPGAMTPKELMARTKPDAKNIYWLDGRQYVIQGNKVREVRVSAGPTDRAYVIEEGVQTGEVLERNHKGEWLTHDAPKLRGGGRLPSDEQILRDLQESDAAGKPRDQIVRLSYEDGPIFAKRTGQEPAEFIRYVNSLRVAFQKLRETPSGQRLINGIASRLSGEDGQSVIIEMPKNGQKNTALYRDAGQYKPDYPAYRRPDGTPGQGGVGMDIRWDPEGRVVNGEERDPAIGLAHELVHAYRAAHGQAIYRGVSAKELFNLPRDQFKEAESFRKQKTGQDELETVGILPPPDADIPTENAFRKEMGAPPRTKYGDYG